MLPGFGTARLRLVASHGDADEARIGQAGTDGRDAAAERLARRFGGFRLDQVDRTLSVTAPMVLDVEPAFLDSLGAVDMLDDTLRGVDAAGPLVRVLAGAGNSPESLIRSHPGPGRAARLRALPTADAIASGTTLILNDIADRANRALADLVDDMARVTGAEVGVNAYISERDSTGFGRHWDDHDVVIVQLTGTKHWRIFEPIDLAPLRGWTSDEAGGREALSILLRPGQGLLLPRGWGHAVGGFPGELSAHLTISVTRTRARTLIELASTDPQLSRLAGTVVPVDRPALARLPMDDSTLDHLVGGARARLVTRTSDDVVLAASTRSASRDIPVRGCFVGGAVFADPPDRAAGCVVLAAAGHLISLPRSLVGAMTLLLDSRPHALDELASASTGATAASVAQLVSELSLIDLIRTGATS